MFLEALEPRQMMTLYPLDPAVEDSFTGNVHPEQHVKVSSTDALLTAPASGNKLTIGMDYLKANAAEFGVTQNDLNHVQITDQYTGANGITHIYLRQMFNGLPIVNADASVHISANGQVVSASMNFLPGLNHPLTNTQPVPANSATAAVTTFATKVGVSGMHPILVNQESTGYNRRSIVTSPDISDLPIPVELHYVPRAGGGVQLAWKITARLPNGEHWYDGSIGAEMSNFGQLVQLADWIDNATYTVFAQPNSDPLDGPRALVTDPHDLVASPFGWHDTNGTAGAEFTDTRGNNVSAQEDVDNNNTGGARPNGGPGLNFDFPYDPTQTPVTNQNAAITNLFYWNNLVHDVTFHHGFDEVSGNFQVLNLTGLGLGSDDVQADALDGSGTNNANFGTPPDGQQPRMQQFIFNITTPNRDSDFDGDIIAHEYGHGVSNRLTGGPANAGALQCLQSGGMGEGWSDWLGAVFDLKPGENRDTPQAFGNWVLGQPANGPGVRRFPYSFDMSINPQTLGDFNGGFPNNEVHNAGELWASALWDMTWLLIGKHGFNANLYEQTGGLQVAMNIVLEGMKLQPANPSFLDARDAILAADVALYGGENFDEIWDAFARRGFGLSADIGVDCDSQVVVEAFDRPPPLARVQGTVFQDVNGNARRDAADIGLEGWTVYVDANNNAQLDTGEKSTVSGVGGIYTLTFFGTQTVTVREVVQPDWKQVVPKSGFYQVTPPGRGLITTGIDFGNQELPGEIHGLKYNDLDGDGVRDLDDPLTPDIDETEPGIEGVVIYVDLNNNNRIGIMEPAAVTDRFGRYTIKNVQPATNYTVREVLTPGMVLTQPSPLAPDNGEYSNVVVIRNAITENIDFGNTASIDFGDAPTAALTGFAQSYPTLLSQNGPRHGILPGFGLGAFGDGEPDGRPTNANATGDDIFPALGPDDEDGVVILGLQPGSSNGTIQVTVRNGGFAAGYLQGWIDWNRDGDWSDPGEQIITNRLTRESDNPTIISNIQVPNIPLGLTYARFRYGYEQNIGPTGAATAGEVEDYQINILDNIPIANPDTYGGVGNPPVIRQDSVNNLLLDASGRSVLGNDQGTIGPGGVIRAPRLNPADFPLTTAQGGTVIIHPSQTDSDGRSILVYTPAVGFVGTDTFQYQVNDGAGNFSNFATVTLIVTASNPTAIDDFVDNIAPSAAPTLQPLVPLDGPDLMSNDVFPNVDTFITSITRITPNPPVGEQAVLTPNSRTFQFRPAPNFSGTVIYEYTIDDSDPLTNPATARVTIQIVPGAGAGREPVASHMARLDVQFLNLDGTPLTSSLQPNAEFLVRVTAEDLAPTGPGAPAPFTNRTSEGVEAAFIDLRYDASIASPVPSATNPRGFDVVYEGSPSPNNSDTLVDTSAVAAAPAATANAFSGDNTLDSSDDFYNGLSVRFTSGPLLGQRARIADYVGATRRFIFDNGSFTQAPSAGDPFRIEAPLYNTFQTGALNSPVFGQIDEAGGFHTDPSVPVTSVGAGRETVFTIRFRVAANAPDGSQFRVIGDPADPNALNQDVSRILLTNRPNPNPNENVPLTDEQVYIEGTPTLTVNDANPEFSNLRSPLDVNDDNFISPVDALIIIDELNANGSRPLSQADIAFSSAMPVGFVDVNVDAHIAAVDALMVIDYLNAHSGLSSPPAGSGEGEGNAPAAFASGADAGAVEAAEGEAGNVVNASASTPVLFSAPSADEGNSDNASSLATAGRQSSDPLHDAIGDDVAVAALPVTGSTETEDEDDLELWDDASSQAADEICAELGKLLD